MLLSGVGMLCGQALTTELIRFVEKTGQGLSRRQLSRQLCHQFDFRSPNGRPKEMACRKDLAKLVREQRVRLPERTWRGATRNTGTSLVCYPKIEGSLAEIGPVELILVKKARSSLGRKWNELASHHPLGRGPLCGGQLRYLVRSRAGAWLGIIGFSAPAWALEDRDKWIGWSAAARKSHLHKIICNSRFLILPWVKVPFLASHILSRVCKRLPADWVERYGVEPVLIETFVAPPHSGKCYAAANWQKVGHTKGRGRQDTGHDGLSNPKQIWMYPLKRNFRQSLMAGVQPDPVKIEPHLPAADWAEEEFKRADLKDGRLNKRLLSLARAFYGQPQANVAQACHGNRAATKAAYRFFEHPKVTMDEILKPHYEATFHRCRQEMTVLAVQDTTALDYHGLQQTEGLGPTGTSSKEGLGLWLHSTLVFNLHGTPLGLIGAQCWARDAAQMGKRQRRKELPIAQKESIKWLKSFEAARVLQQACPQTLVVSVADRESDVFELFDQARQQPGKQQPHLLIRASWNRALEAEEQLLWDKVASLSPAGQLELQVPRRGTQASRVAGMEVRFSRVKLRAPQRLRKLEPVELFAIEAKELGAPKAIKPLHWQLLTTLPVESFEQALEKLHWYAKRWGIEVFHRTLKSGCKIEERQLGHADRIEACLAIDVVVAWRIFHLCKLGRETPNVPCTVYFEEAEWKALVAFVTRTHPQNPPTLREATRMTASLGGFLGRKADAEPGTQTLWLGLQKLDTITDTWIAFNALYPERVKGTVSSNRTYG
jgi:hypothetical protein